MLILGVQHMFAMFGATVLVPLLTGLSVSTTLLCAGLGTLLFHFITKGKVPAFLGSSFAYLGGFSIVAPMLADADGNLTIANTQMLPYACAAIAFSGLVYLAASLLISTFGIRRIMRFFPPVVTGPIIILIGLNLSGSAIANASICWWLALVAIAIIVVANMTFQSVGKAGRATFLACCRQGVFFIPLILILPRTLGLVGVETCQPIADALTFIVSLPFLLAFLKQLDRMDDAEKAKAQS